MRFDIQFNDDLVIKDGDFVIGQSDLQHINDIVISAPGAYKETPLLGVKVEQFQQGMADISAIQKIIKTQLLSDGYAKSNVFIKNGEINVSLC